MLETEETTAFDFGKIVVLDEEQDNDNEEITAHIYRGGGNVAFCGLKNTEDKHAKTHPNIYYPKGHCNYCPECGAKVCPECLRIGRLIDGEKSGT